MKMHIRDIHSKALKRAATNHDTYKSLFESCCTRIKRRAEIRHAPTMVEYRVPVLVLGRPPYDRTHATRYVSEKLRRNGFEVQEPSPGILNVQWTRTPPTAPPVVKRTKTKTVTKTVHGTGKLSDKLAALRKKLS
jgi:hypothetical protein